MQRRLLAIGVGIILCSSLSCAFRAPVSHVEVEVPVATVETPGEPSRADEIEAVLARHLTGLAPFEVRRAAEAVIVEAERNGLDPKLVLAVIHTESGYYNFARSPVGALGLMQIMPATGEMLAREEGIPWKGPDMLFEPTLNLRLGTRYLAFLHARYDGDWRRALAAYNWGPGAIDRRLAEGETVPVLYTDRIYARLARQ
jgi:soluble lytic murein transglycosylase-like protein